MEGSFMFVTGILWWLLLPAVALKLCYLLCTNIRRPVNGPKSYPTVGFWFSLWKNQSRLPEWFTELLREAPTQTIKLERLGGIKAVVTANPANVEHILKTRFENFPKGHFSTTILQDLLGRGIFNADGDVWKLQRKVASAEFSTRSLRNFMVETIEGELNRRLLPLLRRAAAQDGGSVLDLQDVLKRFAFDNICNVAFGIDPRSLQLSLPPVEFAQAFDVAVELSEKRFSAPHPLLWRVKRMLNLGSERRLRQAIRAVHSFAIDVIRRRKEEHSISRSKSQQNQDLLSRFIVAIQPDDEEFLRDVIINFILAGRDTTSAALTWFFWLLSSHPRVEQSILEEIQRVVTARSSSEHRSDPRLRDAAVPCFSYEELKAMDYLQASVCESMRLYPPVPVDSKEALQADVLPDGTAVAKGARVSYHPYAMGRMESIWGTDCLEFKPERWLQTQEDGSFVFVAENPFRFPVFQAGPRICLGKEMAFIQMKCIAASVIKEFRLKVVSDHLDPKFVAALTARMKGGLFVRVAERSKAEPEG